MRTMAIVAESGTLGDFLKAFARKHYGLADGEDTVVVDKSYVQNIQSAQDALAKIVGLSDEEKERRTAEYNASLMEMDKENERVKANEPTDAAVERMIELVDDWETDDAELAWIRKSAFEHLDNMLHVSIVEVVGLKSVEDWHAEQLEIANRHLQNQISIYEYQLEEVAIANKAIKELDRADF